MAGNQTNQTGFADLDYVESVVRRSGTSFFWAMRRLPAPKRRAMYAIYAFCREVDDVADGPEDPRRKRVLLGQWRDEIERLYGDRPSIPVTRALAGPVARHGLRKEDFRALIDGMEMDAGESVRIADMAELELYCDRVAGAVGRLSNRVFGVDEERGARVAFALGQALQLTNILRDLSEDAERDRLYLPGDVLRAHGVDDDDDDPAAVLVHPRVVEVCELLADVARRRFAEAADALAACDRRQMRPAVMMMEVYRRILYRLMRRGWPGLGKRLGLSGFEKLWLTVRYGLV